jgi:cytochrome b561
MKRNIIAIAAFVSFLAMSSSGMVMFFNDSDRMNDLVEGVHLTFGFILTFSVLLHILLNFAPLKKHLQEKSTKVVGTVLCLLLSFLYLAPIYLS